MALPSSALPFGLRDVKIFPIEADGTLGTGIDLPAARTFSFTDAEDFEELQGDDTTVASHGAGPVVEWELEGGGISFAAWQALSGGTTETTGVAPSETNTYTKLTTDSRPYFQVEGQAISDSGGDFHGVVYRCKADGSLEGSMENGSFLLTSASGKGYGDTVGDTPTNKLYEFVHNETVTPISG
jgi:hypothetical protein